MPEIKDLTSWEKFWSPDLCAVNHTTKILMWFNPRCASTTFRRNLKLINQLGTFFDTAGYFEFCVIRHPVARFISNLGLHRHPPPTEEQVLKIVEHLKEDTYYYAELIPQHTRIAVHFDTIDFFIVLENIEQDFLEFKKLSGLSLNKLVPFEVTRPERRELARKTTQDLDLLDFINEYYEEDWKLYRKILKMKGLDEPVYTL